MNYQILKHHCRVIDIVAATPSWSSYYKPEMGEGAVLSGRKEDQCVTQCECTCRPDSPTGKLVVVVLPPVLWSRRVWYGGIRNGGVLSCQHSAHPHHLEEPK